MTHPELLCELIATMQEHAPDEDILSAAREWLREVEGAPDAAQMAALRRLVEYDRGLALRTCPDPVYVYVSVYGLFHPIAVAALDLELAKCAKDTPAETK